MSTVGAVTVKATDDSDIEANVGSLAASVAAGGSAGVGVAIGVAYAHNRISDGTESGTGAVTAYVSGGSIHGTGLVDVEANAQETISAATDAASASISGGGSTGVAIAGGGVGDINESDVAISAYVSGGTISSGGLKVYASDASTITANAGAAAVSGAIGGSGGVAVSIGVSVAKNTIDDPVSAYVTGLTSLTTTGAAGVSVGALEDAEIQALSVAASASFSGGGSAGVAVAAAGAAADNFITAATSAYIVNSTLGSVAGATAVKATDNSEIDAIVGAAAVAAAVGGSAGVGVAIGVSVALNKVAGAIDAHVQNSAITATGLLDIEAAGMETINAISAAGSAAIAGGGDAGVGVAGAGAADVNDIAVGVSAYATGGSGLSSKGVMISASDTSAITASVEAASLAVAIGGAAGVSVAVGISVAQNNIDDPVTAYIASVPALAAGGGAISVTADSSATISATSLAAAVSAAGGGAAGVAVSGGGAIALNAIGLDTEAYVSGSKITGAGATQITATEGGAITATIASVTGTVGVGGAAGVAVGIGVSLAQNEISSGDLPGGGNGKVYADIVDSSFSGAGVTSVTATSAETIAATVAAVSAALAGGGAAGVAVTFAGAFSANTIAVSTRGWIDGGGSATFSTGGVNVAANDTAEITAQVGAASIGAAVGGAAGVAVSVGLSSANNAISGDQQAYVVNVKSLTLGRGALSVKTNEAATINAEAAAAALTISGGIAGVSASGAATTAANAIKVDVDAHVAGSDVASAGAVTVAATEDDHIWALIDSSSAAAGFGLAGVGVAVGSATAQNAIADGSASGAGAGTLTAYILDTPIQASGALQVGTTANNNIFAQVGSLAAAISGGFVGVSAAGAGASATNIVNVNDTADIASDLASGTQTAVNAGSISVTGANTSSIKAEVDAAAVGFAFGAVGVAVSIGVATATNAISDNMQVFIGGAANGVAVDAHDGAVDLSASDSSTINADTMGTALAISGGLGAVSVGGAGAAAVNVILDETDAYLSNATVSASGAVGLSASSNPTINADILALSFAAAIGIGGAASLGVSVAQNYIGYTESGAYTPDQVEATATNSSVQAGGAFSESATDTAEINANVAAASIAATAAGDSLAGAGVSAQNQIAVDTQASITGSGKGVQAGSIALDATDSSTITAQVAAASLAATLDGFAGALAVSVAQNTIDNSVDAFISGAAQVKSSGETQIEASESADISALAAAAAAAAGLVAVSGGGAVALNTITTSTEAYLASSSVTVGSLDIEAHDASQADADTGALSVAIGLSLAAGGSAATDTITNAVQAYIDASSVNAGSGAVTVAATAAPEGRANAAGITAGLVAIGASVAKVTLTPTVSATVDGVINAGSLSVQASVNLPSDEKPSSAASANGSGGALIGVLASDAISNIVAAVTAAIGDLASPGSATGTILTLSGALVVAANTLTQTSSTASNSVGDLIAAGVADSTSNVSSTTRALVGANAMVQAGSASIGASGDDNLYSEADAGSGGVAAGASVQPTNNDTADTTATLGQGADVALSDDHASGAFSISAAHTATLNTRIDAATYGLLAGAGGVAANNVISDVDDILDGDVTAYDIAGAADNTFNKPALGSGATPTDNLSGDTGGLASGASGTDTTSITFNTMIDVQGGANLDVIGSTASPGALSLATNNDISGYDQLTFKTGGAVSGAQATATIQTLSDLGEVVVEGGATLDSVGAVMLSADGSGNLTTQVNTNTYGAVTAALADSVIDIRPDNEIVVGTAGSNAPVNITAMGDLDLYAGEGGNFNADTYTAHAYTDAFAGALIPISSVDAHAFVVQTNRITVNASADLTTAGNANLLANNVDQADVLAQAKASSWASSAADDILTLTGGDPANEFAGTSYSTANGYIEVDGQIHTGIARDITVDFTYAPGSTADDATVVSNNPQAPFTFTTTVENSSLVTSYDDALAQQSRDVAALSQNGGDAVLQQQVAFDNQEVSALVTQLKNQGLAEIETNGSIVVLQKTVQVIDVAPIRAQAGQIYLYADQVQGAGLLDAPVDVEVNIVNETLASLQIEGILIPQQIGGIYLNGALVADGSVSADNTAINNSNAANANRVNDIANKISGAPLEIQGTAAFSSITLAPPPAAPTGTADAPASIVIENIAQPLTSAQVAVGVQQPDIIINGSIYAPYATLTVTSNNNIVVSANAEITDDGTVLTSKNNISINQAVEQVNGDPASILTGGNPDNGAGALSAAAISTYENAQIGATANIHSQTISISSEYVDINGNIQAGDAAPTLTINPADIAQQIASIKSEGLATPQLLTLSQSDDPYGDFLVFFNPADNTIEVQPIIAGGGVINIQGHISSTAYSTITAFGYYGDVTIDNNSTYNLVVQGVDASQQGAGVVNITDFNYTDAQGDYRQIRYLTGLNAQGQQTVSSQINYVDPTTGQAVTTGAISTSTSTTRDLQPAPRPSLHLHRRQSVGERAGYGVLSEFVGEYHQHGLGRQ